MKEYVVAISIKKGYTDSERKQKVYTCKSECVNCGVSVTLCHYLVYAIDKPKTANKTEHVGKTYELECQHCEIKMRYDCIAKYTANATVLL